MKHTLIACLALSALSITSCEKEKDEAVAPTKENLAGVYSVTGLTMSINGSQEVSIMDSSMKACERDDTHTLSVSGTYTIKDEGTKCDPATDESAAWSLGTNSKIIIDNQEATIVSFNGKTLVISATETMNGMTSTVKATYSKK